MEAKRLTSEQHVEHCCRRLGRAGSRAGSTGWEESLLGGTAQWGTEGPQQLVVYLRIAGGEDGMSLTQRVTDVCTDGCARFPIRSSHAVYEY